MHKTEMWFVTFEVKLTQWTHFWLWGPMSVRRSCLHVTREFFWAATFTTIFRCTHTHTIPYHTIQGLPRIFCTQFLTSGTSRSFQNISFKLLPILHSVLANDGFPLPVPFLEQSIFDDIFGRKVDGLPTLCPKSTIFWKYAEASLSKGCRTTTKDKSDEKFLAWAGGRPKFREATSCALLTWDFDGPLFWDASRCEFRDTGGITQLTISWHELWIEKWNEIPIWFSHCVNNQG